MYVIICVLFLLELLEKLFMFVALPAYLHYLYMWAAAWSSAQSDQSLRCTHCDVGLRYGDPLKSFVSSNGKLDNHWNLIPF